MQPKSIILFFYGYILFFRRQIKHYLYDFLYQIKITIDETESKMMKEKDVIDYFIKNKSLIYTFFNIFENELNHLKQTHPHIIDSWKYYKEFEKIYKDK